jgi:ribosomal protein S18 acetylase RimI-like enzyme
LHASLAARSLGKMSGSEPNTVKTEILSDVSDAEIESLLQRVYVEGGFTPPELANSLFSAAAVRARGEVLVARAGSEANRDLLGMVIVVEPTSSARRIAQSDEAEMHLLAVLAEHRGRGVGSLLVDAAVTKAAHSGRKRMVLWTQPSMHSAQRLYEAHGFVRAPSRDEEIGKLTGRPFMVFEKTLTGRAHGG